MTYAELIKKVKAVNPEAAEYLDTGARELASFDEYDDNNDLSFAFIWAESKQGHDYWEEINITIS